MRDFLVATASCRCRNRTILSSAAPQPLIAAGLHRREAASKPRIAGGLLGREAAA